MTHQQLEQLVKQLNDAIYQAATEGAWMTQSKISGIKNDLLRLTRND